MASCSQATVAIQPRLKLGMRVTQADSILAMLEFEKDPGFSHTWRKGRYDSLYRNVYLFYDSNSLLELISASAAITQDSLEVWRMFIEQSAKLDAAFGRHDSTIFSSTTIGTNATPHFLHYTRYWSNDEGIHTLTRSHFVRRREHTLSYGLERRNRRAIKESDSPNIVKVRERID
jgi:hypothetical protein